MSQIPKQPNTKLFYKLALFGYAGLLTLMPFWLFVISPREGHSIGFMFVVYILPLLLPLRGIIRDNPYTFAWANFVVLIYFIHGFTLLWIATDELIWILLELLFSTSMFVGCTYYARHRGQELGLKIRKLKEDLADEKSAHERDS